MLIFASIAVRFECIKLVGRVARHRYLASRSVVVHSRYEITEVERAVRLLTKPHKSSQRRLSIVPGHVVLGLVVIISFLFFFPFFFKRVGVVSPLGDDC